MASLFFDLIIVGFLTIDLIAIGGFVIAFARYRKFSTISVLVFAFLLLSFGVVFYGSFIEPQRIVVTTYRWKEIIPDVGEKLEDVKVALIADSHLGPYKRKQWIEKVAKKLQKLQPNLIVLAGDLIFERYEPTDDFAPLADVKPSLGIYAVWGNHDYGGTLDDLRNQEGKKRAENLKKTLEAAGIKVLINESVELSSDNAALDRKNPQLSLGARLRLGGVEEIWTLRADIEKTFGKRASEASELFINQGAASKTSFLSTSVLLAHNPDVIKLAKNYPIDLVLAGHTHAGQIRLPFWGSVPQIPTKLGNRYDEGVFYFERFDGAKIPLVITRGIGESGPRARLFAPPEIVIIQ